MKKARTKMEDFNSATLEDVRNWFNKYYGPNNATIVLAGDIDAKTASCLLYTSPSPRDQRGSGVGWSGGK